MKGVFSVLVTEPDMMEIVQAVVDRVQPDPALTVVGVRWDPNVYVDPDEGGPGAFCIILEPVKAALKVKPRAKKAAAEPTPRRAKGGKARAKKLTPERRSEIARQAANARWSRDKRTRNARKAANARWAKAKGRAKKGRATTTRRRRKKARQLPLRGV